MILFKYIAIGLFASIVLILLAKVVMAGILQRDNDYYLDEYDQGGDEHV